MITATYRLRRLPGANLGSIAARDRTERRAIGTPRHCRQPGSRDTCGSHGLSRRRVTPAGTGPIGRQGNGRPAAGHL